MITTAAAVQASGDTEAGWPSARLLRQRTCSRGAIKPPQPRHRPHLAEECCAMARLPVTFVQPTPSRHDPPGASPPPGRDISNGAAWA